MRIWNCGLALFVLFAGAQAGPLVAAWMEGAQETPPVATGAKGVLGIEFNAGFDTARIRGAVAGLSGPITGAHLHAGKRGEAGGVVVDIGPWRSGNSFSHTWTGFGAGLRDSLLRGLLYVNVHTAANPGGEIRGQLELERDRQFTVEMTGANETPPVSTDARGLALVQVSADDSILTLKAVFNAQNVSAAHLHAGPAGVAGGVVLDLTPHISGNAISARLRASASTLDPDDFLDSLRRGNIYLNIHTQAHPGGEIRGQLEPSQEFAFQADLSAGNEVPAVGNDSAAGMALVFIREGSLRAFSSFQKLTGPANAAHLHYGGPGANGGIALGLTVSGSSTLDSAQARPGLVDSILRGLIYINVHTAAHPGGEIRGQLHLPLRRGSAFLIEGSQEVPPVTTTASGAGFASMSPDGADLRFALVADSLDSAFTAAHFHKAAAGQNGPVVFNLTSLFSMAADKRTELHAAGLWSHDSDPPFTGALAEAFLTDSLYVNVHTERHPAGALRGQLAGAAILPLGIAGRRQPDPASRLIASGTGIRLAGIPGSRHSLRVLDVRGKVRKQAVLIVGAGGTSEILEISWLPRGVYLADWNDKGMRRARFVRR